MKLYYDSMTGNTKRLAERVALLAGVVALPIAAAPRGAHMEPYLLLTYTFNTGAVPASTEVFLEDHHALLSGVVACGSFHWGEHFGAAGKIIAARYGVPLVARVNKAGNDSDVQRIVAWIKERL